MRIRGIIVEYDLPEAAVILGISPRGARGVIDETSKPSAATMESHGETEKVSPVRSIATPSAQGTS